jgi:hypothetical protein
LGLIGDNWHNTNEKMLVYLQPDNPDDGIIDLRRGILGDS